MNLPPDTAEADTRTNAELREAAVSRMLETAIRLIASHGAAKLSLVDVGRESGYSHSLPNYYFKTKKGLLLQVYERILTGFRVHMREWARTRSPVRVRPGLSNVEATIRAYTSLCGGERSKAMHVLWAESFSSTPDLQAIVRPFNEQAIQNLMDQVQIGMARREIRADVDPAVVGTIVLAALRGIAAQALIEPDTVNLEQTGETLIKILRHGLATHSGEGEPEEKAAGLHDGPQGEH